MLYYPQNFLDLFKIVNRNEKSTRNNKILLALFKSGTWILKTNLCKITDMAELETVVLLEIQESGRKDSQLYYINELNGMTFYSAQYRTDSFKGVCEDGSIDFIRYWNLKSNQVFKMKAGKFLRALILETELGKKLPEQVVIYLCEQFTTKWKAYTSSLSTKKTLYVNSDFKKIYTQKYLKGDFGSCMTNKNHHSFYSDAVNANAAYLVEDNTGLIIARAVIFNEVTDESEPDGKKWRLCERQYSTEGSEIYKQMLVDALYNEGYIDAHKTVGASCHEANLFVTKDGKSLSDKKFSIECNLETDETVSYMDSFKFYNYRKGKAYNYADVSHDYLLDITESTIENYLNDEDDDDDEDDYYDEYHNCYVNDVTVVFFHGSQLTCDSDDLDDFCWVERYNQYHHIDDVVTAKDTNNRYELEKDCVYSDMLDAYFYNEKNLKESEDKYVKEHWFYSEIDNDYFEFVLDVTKINIWNSDKSCYEDKTISCDTLDSGIDSGKYFEIDGLYFDNLNPSTNLPYGYKLVKIECETLNTSTHNEAA